MSGEFDVPLHWTGKARMIVRWHTERYLHARPRRDDAARMTKVFESSVAETQTRELER